MKTQQISSENQTEETEDLDFVDEAQPEILYPCAKCGEEYDADNLFCRKLSVLAKIKGAPITDPAEIPKYGDCYGCTDPTLELGRDIRTLRATMAQCVADGERHRNRHRNNGQQQIDQPPYRQLYVSHDEGAEKVLCVSCLERGWVTKISRSDAFAPGWLGVQIMEGLRRHPLDLTTRDFSYIGSAELMKDGVVGYAHCSQCIEDVVEVLRQKARDLGCEEKYLLDKVQSWTLVSMIIGVRKADEKQNQGR